MDKKTSMTFTLHELYYMKEALESRISDYYEYRDDSPDYWEDHKEQIKSLELSVNKIKKRLDKHKQ